MHREFYHGVDSMKIYSKEKRMKKKLINVFLLDQKLSEREITRFKIREVSRLSKIVLVAEKDIKELFIVRKDKIRRVSLSKRKN